ncbi:MAG: Mur ligase domain-containing protein [Sediminicola sp.]
MRVHFIGVGDAVMQQLALILENRGDLVEGSDLVQGNYLPKTAGWFPEKLDSDLDLVIVAPHIRSDNPELQFALTLGLEIGSKAELIHKLTQHATRVVIAGNGGRAAVCALILHVMDYHKRPLDYFLDTHNRDVADMVSYGGKSDFILIEDPMFGTTVLGERSLRTFYRPNIALITDLQWEASPECPTERDFLDYSQIFVDDIVKGGSITYNMEDAKLVGLVEASENTIRKLPFGTAEHFKEQGEVFLTTPEGAMPALHLGDLKWVEGAKWICQHMGVDTDDFFEALASFEGYPENTEKCIR